VLEPHLEAAPAEKVASLPADQSKPGTMGFSKRDCPRLSRVKRKAKKAAVIAFGTFLPWFGA